MSDNWTKLYNQTKPLLDKFYPNYESAKDLAKNILNKQLKQGDRVLDLGCGFHSEDFKEIKSEINLIGLDADLQAELNNKIIDQFVLADLNSKLPLKDEEFNLVYSRFVFEHVKDPQQAYKEVYRILKPGGSFVFLVPNLYNPVILISRILPTFFHKILKKIFVGVAEEEIYPTYYRANQARQIKKQLTKVGFKHIQITKRGGVFEYFMASKVLFFIGIIWERLTDYIGKFTKLHIIIIAQK